MINSTCTCSSKPIKLDKKLILHIIKQWDSYKKESEYKVVPSYGLKTIPYQPSIWVGA